MVDRYNKWGDTTYTKIFVGGLAWQTRSRSLSHHFEQFGEILEAVVIYDKYTGKSKGFGFVTFRDEESARRACEIPNPVIDGRKANCNLAFLGANKHHPPNATYLVQVAKVKPGPHNRVYPFSPGYSAHPQEYYPMTYFNVQTGGNHQHPMTGPNPVYLNYYPVQDQQGSSTAGSHHQYPKFVPVTVLPEQWIPRPVVPMLAPPPTIELPPMAAAEASKSRSRVVIAPNAALPTNSIVRRHMTRPEQEVEEDKEDPNLRILTVIEDS